ncbi:MAG: thymidylate synthase [archaeon]
MLKYYKESIDFGSVESEVSIVTLWTKKDIVNKYMNNYRYIGQLYSGNVGISGIIRNCLYDKKIRHIVVFGADLSRSGESLLNLSLKGTENHKIIDSDVMIEPEIPVAKIEDFRKNVMIHDKRDLLIDELNEFIEKLNKAKLGTYGEPEVFPAHKITELSTFPSDNTGFIVKDDYISGAWLKILSNVMRFGIEKPSSYHERQKEILNLTTVIYKEDPNEPKLSDYLRFNEEELKSYYEQIISAKKIDNIEYTYGIRLRDYDHIDQIKNIIDKLRNDMNSRRAIAITWDVLKDASGELSPCLILIQAIVQKGRLFLTSYFRSNDMFEAWPKNAFALRKLQFIISGELGILPGYLTIISSSAHIYERNFDDAKLILQENRIKNNIHDARGNIIIHIKDGLILVQHQGSDGDVLSEYNGKNAKELFNKLVADNVLSEISHALDIGAELQKAEIAAQKRIEYRQDNRLNFV